MTAANITFGQWLKQRRKALHLTQRALAQQAGCAEVTLRKIEAGDLQPSAPLVASLASALGVADADLPGLLSLARGADGDFSTRARLLRPQRPHNLPAQLTPLIGREHDVAAVRNRLLSDGARLVTLVGPPGVGKTRLALAVAEDVLEQFEDGAFFVRLGPVSDPALVASAIAQALGIEMSGANPPAVQLRTWLEERHLLLVLDNFEQIVAAAPLVDDLLRRCPWLHVLVTSRQPLRVRGERQMSVRPLAMPVAQPGAGRLTGEDALRYAAVALFAERAEAVQPDFAVDDGNAAAVAELCRRLDGLPLAIELVAARVKLLPPAELLQRLHGPWLLSTDGLRDVSARQKTLRGAIGWSYDLLSPAEQTMFRYLSVFVGGFTLEAAELLCGDTLSPPLPVTLPPSQVLDGIASLLDKSLVQRQTGLHGGLRYVMLETVREYGLERLATSGEEETLRERHVHSLLKLIEQADLSDPDPGQVALLNLVDDEIFNLRAALAWTAKHDVQAALLLYTALLNWSGQRGSYTDGDGLIDKVLNLPGAGASTIARVNALLGIARRGGDVSTERRRAYAQEAMTLSVELGYPKGEADALFALGRIAHDAPVNDWNAARNYLEASLTRYQTLGDLSQSAYALAMLSEVALMTGDFSQARALAEQSLAAAQNAGFNFPWPYGIMANLAWGEGDMDTAHIMYEQLLAAARHRGLNGTLVYALTDLGDLATRQGDFVAAHAFLDEAFVYLDKMGDSEFRRACIWHLAALAQAEGDNGDALRLYRASLVGLRHYPDDWSRCISNLATMSGALGWHELSARLLGAVALTEETGQRLFPIEREEINRLTEAARTQLGEARFAAAWALGREQGFEQAAREALSILEAAVGVDVRASAG